MNGDNFTESFLTSASISSNAGTYAIVPNAAGNNLADYAILPIQNGTLSSITQAGTTTALTVSGANITPGQKRDVDFKVTSAATTGTPTGTVSLPMTGTNLLGTSALTAGSASFNTTSLAAGVTHVPHRGLQRRHQLHHQFHDLNDIRYCCAA